MEQSDSKSTSFIFEKNTDEYLSNKGIKSATIMIEEDGIQKPFAFIRKAKNISLEDYHSFIESLQLRIIINKEGNP